MSFRFEITEAFPARKPVVALLGWLREGDIKRNDIISVPYTDDTTTISHVLAIDAFHKHTNYVSAEGLEEQIYIVVRALDINRVKIGSVATLYRRVDTV